MQPDGPIRAQDDVAAQQLHHAPLCNVPDLQHRRRVRVYYARRQAALRLQAWLRRSPKAAGCTAKAEMTSLRRRLAASPTPTMLSASMHTV